MYYGKLARDKTFFPAHWPREKVISKIVEAYDNFIAQGAKQWVLEADGKYRIRAVTNEGIELRMHMTKSGEIVTAYPMVSLL